MIHAPRSSGFDGMNFNTMDGDTEIDEHKFGDTQDGVLSAADSSSDCSEVCLSSGLGNCALEYEFWTRKPDSVCERRDKFLRWVGFSSDWERSSSVDDDEYSFHEDMKSDTDGLGDNETAMLSNRDGELQFFSSRSLQSFHSCDSAFSLDDGTVEENPALKINNLNNGTEYVLEKVSCDGTLTTFREVGTDKLLSFNKLQKAFGSASLVQQLLKKDFKGFNILDPMKSEKRTWLQRLGAMANLVNRTKEFLGKPENFPKIKSSLGRIHVNTYKKNMKELSSLYTGQEFPAHEGSILTMKFSPDGQYLATAGVDGVVRIWDVLEDDIVNKFNTQNIDPSCLYFSLNHFSKIAPLHVSKERESHAKSSKKSSDSVCVVLPPKAFKLSEKPVHEFQGHEGEVLALSWSRNGHVLSSSVDKTARLWRVGHDQCLGVYSHNNYVTCVDFNPADDNSFMTGSIDGKLRIWGVDTGRVIDWTDIREIVTAVCYSPGGKGGIVGSMDGNCYYFDIIDNQLQMGAQICLEGKKRLPCKRITGFQYCPSDASRVMVTSADSQVRILCGTNVVCKFKGNRSSGSQAPASFTSDGEHIVMATEDSDVRVWTYPTPDLKTSQQKKNIWSYERFLSRHASIAIPWCGLKNKLGALPGSILGNGHLDERLPLKFPASFPDCFTTSLGFFLDALHKGGSPTWPEEKLPKSNPAPAKPSLYKSDFKFLKNAWLNAFHSPHSWGLVIVTAGWDGCIRTFLNHGLPIRF